MVDKTKAFPNESPYDQRNGMDLRDYFAAQAMQGLLAANPEDCEGYADAIGLLAQAAYEVADAMMEARKV